MARAKHSKSEGHWAVIPDRVTAHPDYYNLSGNAVKLLVEFARQKYKNNNGKLCAIYSQLKPRGWKSEATLRRSIKELLEARLIIVSKVGHYTGGGRKPNFYAVTWEAVSDIKNFDMDISPTIKPIRKFDIELREIARFRKVA